MRIKHYLMLLLLLFGIYSVNAQTGAPFKSRLGAKATKVRGNIKLVGNTILGHTLSNPTFDSSGNVTNLGTLTNQANQATPNGANGQNDSENMEYIDIDGDASTFSSSSAYLDIDPKEVTCKRIVFAGLYWAATYPYERGIDATKEWESFPLNTPRIGNFNQIKFKLPGGAYQNITADETIYDGYNASNISASFKGAPYVCFKDVTTMLQGLPDANGNYTVGNVRAARGKRLDGSSAGWSLVVIYESPNANVKPRHFVVYDGLERIAGTHDLTIAINNFKSTLAGKFDTNIGVAALDGDREKNNDKYQFSSFSGGPFIDLKDSFNAFNNFFDSSLTDNNAIVNNINPIKNNTYGFDLDQVELPNPGQSVLVNGASNAYIRLTTEGANQDAFMPYVATFSVDDYVPNVVLTKTVNNLLGANIDGQQIPTCRDFKYIIGFQNLGSDDAIGVAPANPNYVIITDVLPANVTYVGTNVTTTVPGSIVNYDAATRTLRISIPKSYLEVNDPRYAFEIYVRTACACADITDACSTSIKNQAFISYQGESGGQVVTSDPSSSVFDSTCLVGNGTPTNSTILPTCIFESNVYTCDGTATLTGPVGYDNYTWTGPSGATFTPNANSQTVTVNITGNYTVVGTKAGCAPITYIFHVIRYSSSNTHPIIPYDQANPIQTCDNTNERIPYIYLCGANGTRDLDSKVTDAESITWQIYNTACGAFSPINCPNTTASCWTNVGTGQIYTVSQEGDYRIILNYGNCSKTFYFKVFKNNLDYQIVKEDIFCNTPGSITVMGVPQSGYTFSLLNSSGTVIQGPQASNVFVINTAGVYNVNINQTNVTNGCVFTANNIAVLRHVPTAQVISYTQPVCFGDKGSITLAINDGRPNYYFSISDAGGLVASSGAVTDNVYTFNNLTPGVTYTWTTTTDDGCPSTGTITIDNPQELKVKLSLIKALTCTAGRVQVDVEGGTGPYFVYLSPNSGPPSPYLLTNTFDVSAAGTYTVTVWDSNNCKATGQITVNAIPAATINPVATNIRCYADGNVGRINFNPVLNGNDSMQFAISTVSAAGPFTYGPASVFTGLAPGRYYCSAQYIYNGEVCTIPVVTLDITRNAEILPTLTNTEISCTAGTNTPGTAVITASATGGVAPIRASINGGANFFPVTHNFTVSGAGTYTVIFEDAVGCRVSRQITIAPITPLQNMTFTPYNLRCNVSSTTGTVDVGVNVTGGTGTYTYQIVAPVVGTPQSSNQFTGLTPGTTYTFQVTDAKGCTLQRQLVIPALPVIGVTLTAPRVCYGVATGSIQVTVTGTTNFQYTINNGSRQPYPGSNPFTISNQPVNTPVTITVYDTATDCNASSSVTIPVPANDITGTLNVTPIRCSPNYGSVTVSGVSGGWGGPYRYELLQPNGTVVGPQTANVFTNLTQTGSYTVTIIDSNGCRKALPPFVLTAPSSPDLTLLPSSDLCNDSNGTSVVVQVTAGTGTAPFQFSLNGGAYVPANMPTNGHQYTNLPTGGTGHVITVRDVYGCTDTVILPVLNTTLTAMAVITKGLDCSASPNAVIRVNISGGYPAYEYQVSYNGGAYGSFVPVAGATFNYSAAVAGTYTFRIRDSRGCTYTTATVVIPALIPVAATYIKTDNKCFGDSMGSFTVQPSGGQAPYMISVNGNPFTSQTTYSGLAAGNYTVNVRDANQCLLNPPLTITIGAPNDITWTHNTNSLSCGVSGIVLGSIEILTLGGGTAPYMLTLVDLSGATPNVVVNNATAPHTFSNLNFGNYQVFVTDANGCSKNFVTTVATPVTDLTIDVTTVPGDCTTGACIKLTALGGTGPYFFAQYPVNPSNPNSYDYATYSALYQPESAVGSGEYTFCGLASGVTYSFIVYDQGSNCYFFRQAGAPTVVYTSMTVAATPKNVTCKGAADGSVSFTISSYGGTSVSYQIFNAVTNQPVAPTLAPATLNGLSGSAVTVSNIGPLPVGTYYVVVRELDGPSVGCTNASNTFAIVESPTVLSVTAQILKNANCNAAGTIQINALGGTAPYLYYFAQSPSPAPAVGSPLWSGSNIGTIPFGNSAPFDVYVLDAYGCIRSTQITMISDPLPSISAVVNPSTVCNAEGAFAIDVTINATGVEPYTYSVNGGAYQNLTAPYPLTYPYTFTISNLSSGTYDISLLDKNGCESSASVIITPPLNINADFSVLPECNDADGTITANASGGSGVPANYQYTLYDSAGTTILVGPQSGNTFPNMAPGTYWVQVRDITTNCTARVQVSLVTAALLDFTLAPTNVSCFGGSDGTITVTNVVGDAPFKYQIIAPVVMPAVPQDSNVFIGLAAGSYTVEVTSARGCKISKTIPVTQPAALILNPATVSSPTCSSNAIQPVTVTVNVSGGTAPYLYSFNSGAFTSNNVYTVFATTASQTINYDVKDANGCPVSGSEIVPAYTPLSALGAGVQPTCAASGSYTITPSGGSGGGTIANYTYTLVGGNAAGAVQQPSPNQNVFTISQPGLYYFRVTDANGCWVDLPVFDVPAYDIITISAPATTDVVCFGTASGTIGPVTINNYSGDYSWQLQGSALSGTGNTGTPLTINNVPAGSYTLLITETQAPFCDATVPVDITAPAAPLAVSIKIDALVSCGSATGIITVDSITGGWGSYEYQLVNQTTGTSFPYGNASSFSNLPAGTYYVNVRDAKGCIVASNQVTLNAPTQITNVTAVPSVLACANDTNGTITVSGVTGGVAGAVYQYILVTYYKDAQGNTLSSQSVPQLSNVFNDLNAGDYGVIVQDGYNCNSTEVRVTIINPSVVTASVNLIANSRDCLSGTETITLTASGGTGSYSYATTAAGPFTAMATNPVTFTVNPNGSPYTYYVKDSNDCISGPAVYTVAPVVPLTITINANSQLQVLCFGDVTGSLYIDVTGGLGTPYTINVTGPAGYNQTNTTGIFTDLAAGNYNISVTNGTCTAATTQSIASPNPPLQATATWENVVCRGDKSGFITVIIQNNGVATPIQYQLDNLTTGETVGTVTILDPFNPAGLVIPELAAGNYTLVLSDKNGCQFVIDNILISEPLTSAFATAQGLPESCAEFNDGIIEFTNIGGGNPGTYTLGYSLPPTLTNPNPTPIAELTNVAAGPGPFNIMNVDGSVAVNGVFEAYIIDSKGCKTTYPVRVDPGVVMNPDVRFEYDCDNSTVPNSPAQPYVRITVINKDTNALFSPAANYFYSLDVDDFTTAVNNPVFTSVTHPQLLDPSNTNHTIYVYHVNGCKKSVIDVIVDVTRLDPLIVDLQPGTALNQVVANTNNTDGTPSGAPPYTYAFDLNGFGGQTGPKNTFIYYQSGTVTVTVTDENGCIAIDSLPVTHIPICVSDVMTPGGADGTNDEWGPGCVDPVTYPNLVTKIYDRYGRLVKTLPVGETWDGKYEGKDLPSGDYWYVIKVDKNEGQEIVGHFTLYR
ncbi:T9SS type B sorting domain-containing protein [Flavobacterium sp. H122]|uniref:T9SS type B sorting domain-containing protein n=1 Tax=Flavobacterium sp. H122 TaxID=2529860 RepID=UPI0010A9CF92|nr:T9SS type B sorting domain-containing protein [Flavobacterium sp. H122]